MGAGPEMVRSWNWIGSKKTVVKINVKLEWNETIMIDPKKKRECTGEDSTTLLHLFLLIV